MNEVMVWDEATEEAVREIIDHELRRIVAWVMPDCNSYALLSREWDNETCKKYREEMISDIRAAVKGRRVITPGRIVLDWRDGTIIVGDIEDPTEGASSVIHEGQAVLIVEQGAQQPAPANDEALVEAVADMLTPEVVGGQSRPCPLCGKGGVGVKAAPVARHIIAALRDMGYLK